jgi:hypothetical protein
MLVDYVRVSAYTSGPPPPAGGTRLKSNLSGRCIDIPFANPADGTQLDTWDCSPTGAHHRWTFEADGTVRSLGKCMDPAGAGSANGTAIQIVTCNGNPVQRFTFTAAGDLVNVSSNRCVDIKDRNTNNGAKLQLWDCNGQSNQKWTKS